MRKLKCFEVAGLCVQEVLDEFTERREEFGVADDDILSVSAYPSTSGKKVEVVIVYWGDK